MVAAMVVVVAVVVVVVRLETTWVSSEDCRCIGPCVAGCVLLVLVLLVLVVGRSYGSGSS